MTFSGVRLLAAVGLVLAATLSANAQQSQQRSTTLNLNNDEPIQIESDRLEVRDNDRQAVFTGNVSVVQGKTEMKAGKMTVFYKGQAMAQGSGGSGSGSGTGGSDNNASGQGGEAAAQPASTAGAGSADIERIEVDGKVYVRSEQQVATGDRATFDMNSETLVLSGNEVVLTEGENVIMGCRLTVQMNNGQAQLDGCGSGAGTGSGRVRMLLQPGSQNQ